MKNIWWKLSIEVQLIPWRCYLTFLEKKNMDPTLFKGEWLIVLFFFFWGGGGITFFLCNRPIHNGSHSQIFEITFFFSLETKIDRGTQFAEKRTITITIFTTFLVKIWLNFEKYLVKIVNRGSIDPLKVLFNIFGEKKYGPNPV